MIKTTCPECRKPLEFPQDFDNVICAACGTAYQVRQYKGAINLHTVRPGPPEPNGGSRVAFIEATLAELDASIEEAHAQVEAIRGREQGAPLQMGCALFGLFCLVIIVFAVFTTVAREYFGGWLFYLTLAAVIGLGLMRMRRRLTTPEQLDQFRADRTRLEDALIEMEAERERLLELRDNIAAKERELPAQGNGNP